MQEQKTIFLRDSMKVFLLMNERAEWYGENGGWRLEPHQARQFSAEEVTQMLRVFPKSSAIAALVRNNVERRSAFSRNGLDRRISDRRAVERRGQIDYEEIATTKA